MKIYVGWDSREDIAYQVCEHSIKRRDPQAEVYPLYKIFCASPKQLQRLGSVL